MEKWIGNFDPSVLGLPRRSQFIVVLKDVLVAAVHGKLVRAASSADRYLKTRIRSDHVIGQDAAITPTTDAQLVWIRNSFSDGPINASL